MKKYIPLTFTLNNGRPKCGVLKDGVYISLSGKVIIRIKNNLCHSEVSYGLVTAGIDKGIGSFSNYRIGGFIVRLKGGY